MVSRETFYGRPLAVACLFVGLMGLPIMAGPVFAGVPLAGGSSEAAVLQYRTAVGLQNRSVFDLASDEWEVFLRKFPNDPLANKARHYRGVCLIQTQKYDEAAQLFEAVIAKDAKFELAEQTLFNLSLAYTGLKQSDKADATYKKLLEKFPTGKLVPQILSNRGDLLYGANKKEEASKVWKELLDKHAPKAGDSFRPETLYSLGVVSQELGRFDEADKHYDTFLKENPQHPQFGEVTFNKAELMMVQKKFAEAEQQFAVAAKLKEFGQADQATMRQADAMAMQKKHEQAAALYLSVPKKFAESKFAGPAMVFAGNNFYLANKQTEARESLGKALAAGGERAPEAAHWIARSWLKDGKPVEALKIVEQILPSSEKSPYFVEVLMDQADASFEIADKKPQAIEMYARIAEKHADHPQAAQALYNAAFAALGMEKYDQALSYAKLFQDKFKDHNLGFDVKTLEAESLLLSRKYPDADIVFKQLLDKPSANADLEQLQIRRGLCLNLQRKDDESIKFIQSFLPTMKDPAKKAEAQYLLGSAQLETKKLPEAIKSFELALTTMPKGQPGEKILLALAQAQRQSTDVKGAISSVRRLIQEYPKSAQLDQAHFRLGDYLNAEQDYKSAVAEYEAVLIQSPNSVFVPNSLYGLGWSRINQQDYANAVKTLSTLIEKHPQHPLAQRARYSRAVARQLLGENGLAIEDLNVYLATALSVEEKSDALYLRGMCEGGLKKFGEAIQTLEAVLKADPKYASTDKVLYEMAWAYKGDKKESDASSTFARLAKETPNSPLLAESLYHVGEFQYGEKKDFNAASVAYYESFNKAGKSDLAEKAGHKLGWSYYQLNDFGKAQTTFASQLQNYPAGELAADGLFMNAECLFKQNKHREAVAAYDAALAKKPTSKDFGTLTLLHAGQASGQLKDWSKSLEYLERCAKNFPDSPFLPEVQYEQGWAKKNQEKLDEALKLFETAADAAPNRISGVRGRFMQGEILFQTGKHSEAVRQYFKVIAASVEGDEFKPWQAHATYEAALCLETLKKKEEAKKLYQEVIQKFPKSEHVAEAQKRLAAIGK